MEVETEANVNEPFESYVKQLEWNHWSWQRDKFYTWCDRIGAFRVMN